MSLAIAVPGAGRLGLLEVLAHPISIVAENRSWKDAEGISHLLAGS